MKEETIKYAEGLGANKVVLNWLSKQEITDIGETEHIIDYLIFKNYKRLNRATYDQMKEQADKWNKTMQKKGKNIKVSNEDLEVVLDFKDGFKFVKLVGGNEYKREGHLMSHCVASYYGKDVEIYSLRDKDNMPHCTIEKDKQIKGKGNGDIHPKYIDYVVRFLEHTGMQVRDSEMENLGYKTVMFAEHCLNKMYRDKYVRDNEEITYDNKIKVFTDWNELLKYKGTKTKGFLGNLYLRYTQITELPSDLQVGGGLYLSGTQIKELPSGLQVGGGLDLSGTQIKELPSGLQVGGGLDLSGTQIKELPSDLQVGGWLDLSGTQIKELPSGLQVGGGLDLRGTQIPRDYNHPLKNKFYWY